MIDRHLARLGAQPQRESLGEHRAKVAARGDVEARRREPVGTAHELKRLQAMDAQDEIPQRRLPRVQRRPRLDANLGADGKAEWVARRRWAGLDGGDILPR